MIKKIQPIGIQEAVVQVPGSKSYTHRMLIAAALAAGKSTVQNGLDSEDTRLTREGLCRLGARIEKDGAHFEVEGTGGVLSFYENPVVRNWTS